MSELWGDPWGLWERPESIPEGQRVVGFSVRATDGDIGKVDDARMELGGSYIIVDTGLWIVGRRVMLPAGTIEGIDWNEQKVYVDRTKDQIQDSPELTNTPPDQDYRDTLNSYYGRTYGAPR